MVPKSKGSKVHNQYLTNKECVLFEEYLSLSIARGTYLHTYLRHKTYLSYHTTRCFLSTFAC